MHKRFEKVIRSRFIRKVIRKFANRVANKLIVSQEKEIETLSRKVAFEEQCNEEKRTQLMNMKRKMKDGDAREIKHTEGFRRYEKRERPL